MSKRPNKRKKNSRSRTPRSFSVLYEDRDIIVVDKKSGLLTTGNERERSKTLLAYVNDYIRKGVVKSRKRVYSIHGLDRETSGVIVFAKEETSQAKLKKEWNHFKKTYYAVVVGKLPQTKGVISSYLVESSAHKMYSTKESGRGKLAETAYEVVREGRKCSLIKVELYTSRKHQIRVHFSDMGCPIVGDKKYGTGKGRQRLALHATEVSLVHPFTQKEMTFSAPFPSVLECLVQVRGEKKKENVEVQKSKGKM